MNRSNNQQFYHLPAAVLHNVDSDFCVFAWHVALLKEKSMMRVRRGKQLSNTFTHKMKLKLALLIQCL